jgi:hypothetical protein
MKTTNTHTHTRMCIQKFPGWPPGARLQMVQFSATRCSCIAILCVSLVSFTAVTLCIASQLEFVVVAAPETFGYILV